MRVRRSDMWLRGEFTNGAHRADGIPHRPPIGSALVAAGDSPQGAPPSYGLGPAWTAAAYLLRVRQIVLLRGVNLGSRNRIAMPALRGHLAEAGFGEISTYLQSGNVLLNSSLEPEALAGRCRRLIAEAFGLDIAAVARTRDELAEVVRRNPLAGVADDPKRCQVTFLSSELQAEQVEQLAALAGPAERLVALGRELYAWHPEGIARSKLWNALAGPGLGVTATARNWRTVTRLLELAGE